MGQWRLGTYAWIRQVVGAANSVTLRTSATVHVSLNFVIRVLATFHVGVASWRCRIGHHHDFTRILSTVEAFIGDLSWIIHR